MDQCFEVGVSHWPARGWKPALVMVDGEAAVQRLLRRFANLSKNQENLLMYLLPVSALCAVQAYYNLPKSYPIWR
jgi:hypothetical protein